MSFPTKIAVIGAGSASFGENTLSAIMHSKKLRGSTLALVDVLTSRPGDEMTS
jgi:alpha-galactosidase/6-phospho-beta-glucosidase family protein